MRSRGYSFQEEILYRCQTVGCRIGETPILFENRRAGSSKINMREAASALWICSSSALSRLGRGGRQAMQEAIENTSAEGCVIPRRGRFGPARGSGHLALADGYVDFLAGLGDLLAQALVLAFELAGVHPQHLAEEGAVAGVGLVSSCSSDSSI